MVLVFRDEYGAGIRMKDPGLGSETVSGEGIIPHKKNKKKG